MTVVAPRSTSRSSAFRGDPPHGPHWSQGRLRSALISVSRELFDLVEIWHSSFSAMLQKTAADSVRGAPCVFCLLFCSQRRSPSGALGISAHHRANAHPDIKCHTDACPCADTRSLVRRVFGSLLGLFFREHLRRRGVLDRREVRLVKRFQFTFREATKAIQECARGDCFVAAGFQNQCGAVARAPNGQWDWGLRGSRAREE